MTMLCDMCGYNGEVSKNDSTISLLFDITYSEKAPEMRTTLGRQYCICSKCRKSLLCFINSKRSENKLTLLVDL